MAISIKKITQRLMAPPAYKHPIKQPVVLITGCSSGIGFALAKRLEKDLRFRVVLTARPSSIHILQRHFQESERLIFKALDITRLENVRDIVADINRIWGGVDILVNNAGISFRSMVEDMSASEEEHQLATNYLGPMNLIRQVLPGMRKKQAGHIINVSSVSGMMAMPTMSSYSASKFALEGASESLWYEMKPWNIKVSLIQPGFIHSESYKKVHFSSAFQIKQSRSPYIHVYQHMTQFVEKMMKLSRSTPDDIAKIIVVTMLKKKAPLRVPATLDAYLFYYLRRWIPRRIYHPLLFLLLPGVHTWRDKEVKQQAELEKRQNLPLD